MDYTSWETRKSTLLAKLQTISPPGALDYGIRISKEHKCVFLDNPKVASGTIKTRLACAMDPSIDAKMFSPHNGSKALLISPPYLSDGELEDALFSDDYFRFGFVRNPYTRILSAYLDKMSLGKINSHIKNYDFLTERKKKRVLQLVEERKQCLSWLGRVGDYWREEISFCDFILWLEGTPRYNKDMHWRSQTDNLLVGEITLSSIGRFEKLDEDMDNILSIIFSSHYHSKSNLDQVGYATKADTRINKYYTLDLCNRVLSIYPDDFENFGYSFEPPLELCKEA